MMVGQRGHPPKVTPYRNKGLIAGLKGNQRVFIRPSHDNMTVGCFSTLTDGGMSQGRCGSLSPGGVFFFGAPLLALDLCCRLVGKIRMISMSTYYSMKMIIYVRWILSQFPSSFF